MPATLLKKTPADAFLSILPSLNNYFQEHPRAAASEDNYGNTERLTAFN